MVNLLSFIDSVKYTMENAGFDVFIINPQGQIMFMNGQLKRKIENKLGKLDGIQVSTYFTKREIRDFENFVHIALDQKHHISFILRQIEIYGEDMEITINPILNGNTKIIGLTCSVRPIPFMFAANSITSRIYEENLQELLMQFTGGIAHKLNNILTSITGVASLLQLDEETMKKHSSELNLLSQSAYNASHYIDKLKTLSRSDSNKAELSDLNQIVNKVLEEVPVDSRINYSISLDDNPITLLCNPCSIHEVFTNILLNAIESINDHGTIEISSELVHKEEIIEEFGITHLDGTQTEYGCFIVKDNGSGIKHKDLHKIYHPYYSTKNDGRGMGLFIVTSILHAVGGYIKHYSSDDGTTVKLIFPQTTESVQHNQ